MGGARALFVQRPFFYKFLCKDESRDVSSKSSRCGGCAGGLHHHGSLRPIVIGGGCGEAAGTVTIVVSSKSGTGSAAGSEAITRF